LITTYVTCRFAFVRTYERSPTPLRLPAVALAFRTRTFYGLRPAFLPRGLRRRYTVFCAAAATNVYRLPLDFPAVLRYTCQRRYTFAIRLFVAAAARDAVAWIVCVTTHVPRSLPHHARLSHYGSRSDYTLLLFRVPTFRFCCSILLPTLPRVTATALRLRWLPFTPQLPFIPVATVEHTPTVTTAYLLFLHYVYGYLPVTVLRITVLHVLPLVATVGLPVTGSPRTFYVSHLYGFGCRTHSAVAVTAARSHTFTRTLVASTQRFWFAFHTRRCLFTVRAARARQHVHCLPACTVLRTTLPLPAATRLPQPHTTVSVPFTRST